MAYSHTQYYSTLRATKESSVRDSACDAHAEPDFESLGVRPIQVRPDEKLTESYDTETKTNSNFIRKSSNMMICICIDVAVLTHVIQKHSLC